MTKAYEIEFERCYEKHTFLYGDVNTYKTTITAEFVKFLLEEKKTTPEEISILDFAPKFILFENLKIGGRISDFYEKSSRCNYYLPSKEFIPSRFQSKNKKELFHNANHNYNLSKKIINQYIHNPTQFLIINDASMYLQRGNKQTFLNLIKDSHTFFGNSYYGTSITRDYSKIFSLIERKRIEFILRKLNDDLAANLIKT